MSLTMTKPCYIKRQANRTANHEEFAAAVEFLMDALEAEWVIDSAEAKAANTEVVTEIKTKAYNSVL